MQCEQNFPLVTWNSTMYKTWVNNVVFHYRLIFLYVLTQHRVVIQHSSRTAVSSGHKAQYSGNSSSDSSQEVCALRRRALSRLDTMKLDSTDLLFFFINNASLEPHNQIESISMGKISLSFQSLKVFVVGLLLSLWN